MWIGAGCLGMVLFALIFYQGSKYDNSFIMGFAVIGFIFLMRQVYIWIINANANFLSNSKLI